MLLLAAAGAFGQASAPAKHAKQPSSRPISRDEAIWQEVRRLSEAASDRSGFDDERSDRQVESRRELLERVRLYQTLYPGGPRQVQAAQLELQTLFEIGCLRSGEFGPLCRRIAQYAEQEAPTAVRAETAYWAIICRQLESAPAASQPTTTPHLQTDARLLDEYAAYVESFPASRYTPRFSELLFERALEHGDRPAMAQLIRRLESAHPEHAVTKRLAARLAREEAIGHEFAFDLETTDGRRLTGDEYRGKVVLIVMWAGFDSACRKTVGDIEQFRAASADVVAIGVNLDASAQRMTAAARELGIDWPQVHDGFGWATAFARKWAVRRVPLVFVIDRTGTLAAAAGPDAWRAAAVTAIGD